MKTIVGIVDDTNVGGPNTATNPYGNHVRLISIDNQSVQIESKDIFAVQNGDVVAATGKLKNGILQARGAHNATRGVTVKHFKSRIYGGRPVVLWLTVLVLTVLIIPFPLALWLAVTNLMDTGAANKAARVSKAAAQKYQKQHNR